MCYYMYTCLLHAYIHVLCNLFVIYNSKSAFTLDPTLDPAYLYLHLDSSDRILSKCGSDELHFLSSASALILTKSAQIHHYHMQKQRAIWKTELDLDALLSWTQLIFFQPWTWTFSLGRLLTVSIFWHDNFFMSHYVMGFYDKAELT